MADRPKPGDILVMYNRNSNYYNKGAQRGTGTHSGHVVGYADNGEPIIEHYIGGPGKFNPTALRRDPLSALNQGSFRPAGFISTQKWAEQHGQKFSFNPNATCSKDNLAGCADYTISTLSKATGLNLPREDAWDLHATYGKSTWLDKPVNYYTQNVPQAGVPTYENPPQQRDPMNDYMNLKNFMSQYQTPPTQRKGAMNIMKEVMSQQPQSRYAQGGPIKQMPLPSAQPMPDSDEFPYNGESKYKGGYDGLRAIRQGITPSSENGHWPSVDTRGEWLKAKDHPTAWKEFMFSQLNPDVNRLVGSPTLNNNGNLQYNKGYWQEPWLNWMPKYTAGGGVTWPPDGTDLNMDPSTYGTQVGPDYVSDQQVQSQMDQMNLYTPVLASQKRDAPLGPVKPFDNPVAMMSAQARNSMQPRNTYNAASLAKMNKDFTLKMDAGNVAKGSYLGAIGGGIAGSAMEQSRNDGVSIAGSALKQTGMMATTGATVGSMFGPPGTIIGAGAGAVLGLGMGLKEGFTRTRAEDQFNRDVERQNKYNQASHQYYTDEEAMKPYNEKGFYQMPYGREGGVVPRREVPSDHMNPFVPGVIYDKLPVEYAEGGMTPKTTIEVEGDEVRMDPRGDLKIYRGPKHEQGGIVTKEKPGSFIYSDSLPMSDDLIEMINTFV